MASLAKKVLYNAAIIGAGSAALIYYDRSRDSVPKQVQKLVRDAVELELDPQVKEDNGSSARRKWKEAVITAKANQLDPSVAFNTNFFLACNLEEAGKIEESEKEFRQALAHFPLNFDYKTLNDATKNRVSVAMDRLAQRAQDRKDFNAALNLYVEALGILASPEEVTGGDEKFLARKAHVQSVAGLLNNMTTLFYEVGLKEEATKSEDMSLRLKSFFSDDFPVPNFYKKAQSNGSSAILDANPADPTFAAPNGTTVSAG